MKSKHRMILDISILLLWILSSGWYLGAFRGFPKGLDTYQHLTMTKFILKNWPNIRWFSNWYGGTPFYLWYAPLPHHFNVLLVKITTLPIELTIILLSAVSLSLISIGLYCFVYYAMKNHDASLIISLIVSSSPMLGFLVGGGTYARLMGVSFIPLSALFTLMYIKNLQSNSKPKKYYIGTIFLTSAALISHLQTGFFTFFIVALLLMLCVERWRDKILHIFRVFVPVFLLSSFFLLPFIVSSPTQYVGEIHSWNVPVSLSDLILTYPTNWNTVSTLILPIGIIAVLIFRNRKLQFDRLSLGILKSISVIVAFLFIYTFTRIPAQLYIFSPYDSPFYLTLFLAAGTGIILSRIFSAYRPTTRLRLLTKFLIVMVLVAAVLQLPILQSYVIDTGTQSWYSGYYTMQNLIEIDANDTNYRFGSDWDGASTWFNYWYDVPQTRGFYPLGIIHPWHFWLENAVWKENDNYEETNFLLNWYAVKSFAVAWPDYNYQKFLNKPEFYDVRARVDTPTLFTMYQFDYKSASPIVSATDSTTLLIIGENQVYDNVFRSLAYANFNDAHVIPIRGKKYVDNYLPEQLSQFDVIFVSLDGIYYHNFEKAWGLLDEYVKNGGGLVIDTDDLELSYIPEPSPLERTEKTDLHGKSWNFTVAECEVTNWINFLSFSSPQSISYSYLDNFRSGAEIILWSHNYSVAIVREYGAGRVSWNGLNIVKRSADKNFMESIFISKIIAWVSNTTESVSSVVSTVELLTNWSIAWATGATNASIELDSSIKKVGDYSIQLRYNFSDPVHRDEVVYLFDSPGIWNWSDAEFFSLWIFGDGSNHEVTIYLEGNDSRDSYWFRVRLDWIGWKQITYWFDQMNKYGFADISSIKKLEITINDDPYENATSNYINIDGMYVGARSKPFNEVKSIIERPNSQRIEVKLDQRAKGVLLKENYFDRWHVYTVSYNGSVTELSIYRAGPDFMYVLLPEGNILPVEIVFEYQMNRIDLVSYVISFIALVVLVYYALKSVVQKSFLLGIRMLKLIKNILNRYVR